MNSAILNFSMPHDLAIFSSCNIASTCQAHYMVGLSSVFAQCCLQIVVCNAHDNYNEHTPVIGVNYTPNTQKVWKAHLSEEHSAGVQRSLCAVHTNFIYMTKTVHKQITKWITNK